MKILFITILIYLPFFGNCANAPYTSRPQLSTPLGQIEGSFYTSDQGRQYAGFEGIPYAKAPLKKYRFKEPRTIRAWDGTLHARYKYTCLQYNHYAKATIGQEDCLYLNVYTPTLNQSAALDVVVFIHGGAFMFGSGHSYGEKIIMDRDIVFVNFNYRLGPFGFMSTEDTIVPGNMGLKDQVLALKWVKNNIQHFGGNPGSITLGGMSAGGSSVQLHYMSALSQGLFHRGISLGGAALNPWVMQENALEKAKKLATLVGCDSSNTRTLVSCLNYVPHDVIMDAVKTFFVFLYNPFSPFGVVVEPQGTANPFLAMHPYVILKNKQVLDLPWIATHVQSEGLYPGAEFYGDEKYLTEIENRWTDLAPQILDYDYTIDLSEKEALSIKIKNEYLKGKPINKETFMDLIQMISDRLFVTDCQTSAKLQASAMTSPVHYYYFTYRGAHSKSESLSLTNENFGAAHGDDTVYVLYGNIDVSSTASDRKMSKLLVDFWVDYAATGVPKMSTNTAWTPISRTLTDPLNYIEIKSPTEIIPKAQNFDKVDWWLSLPLKENANLFANIREEL